MTIAGPDFYINEKYRSQIPALQVLSALGYKYIPAKEAMGYRYNKSNVILESILLDNLKRLNSYDVKGVNYNFSDGSLLNAIEKLKASVVGGFISASQEKYELLKYGTTETQITDGYKKDKSIMYIDWENPENNEFHMVAEYIVEREKSKKIYRPDIVLFINGIPFCVIECKSPSTDSAKAIRQHTRNQESDGIRSLYKFSQILISSNSNNVFYGTTDTKPNYWARWKEECSNDNDDKIRSLLDIELSGSEFLDLADFKAEKIIGRSIIEQDRAIVGLLSKHRVLSIIKDSIVFDNKTKKIARYQQFFAINKIMERVKQFDGSKRKGGVVWHTQGSGKSLTMVMTAMKIVSDRTIKNPRIIIVTDRKDLDQQIHDTFKSCGYDENTIYQSKSGRDLFKAVKLRRYTVITTLIHKFKLVVEKNNFVDDDSNVFIMVDEAHRSQFGEMHANMQKTFPNASYIGFTGTPISKQDKNTYVKFGTMIDKYTIDQAIEDRAIVPLFYEARHVLQDVNSNIDKWFNHITKNLNELQKIDLKKKYNRKNILSTSENILEMFAWDINEHFNKNIKPKGFKGQVVAPNRESAIKLKNYFDSLNDINTEVVITLGDGMEEDGEVATYGSNSNNLNHFRKEMIELYGNEDNYNAQVIKKFKEDDNVDIVIVVSKLLTGFDEPKNAVIYLCRRLVGHNLLQAIARVNRLYDSKTEGLIVDYQGVLQDLSKTLTEYTELQDFDEADLYSAVIDVKKKISTLGVQYNNLLKIFENVKNKSDTEAYIDVLRDKETRDEFYQVVNKFSRTFDLARSTTSFYDTNDKQTIDNYKRAEKKFLELKAEAKIRFYEIIDFSDYEKKIKRLIDQNIIAEDVIQLFQPVDIMDQKSLDEYFENSKIGTIAKADTIASLTKKTIEIKEEEDPVLYKELSEILQNLIDDFKNKRISSNQYYNSVLEIKKKVIEKNHDNLPQGIQKNTFTATIYNNIKEHLKSHDQDIVVRVVLGMSDIANNYITFVDFDKNIDKHKDLKNDLDDYIYAELENKENIKIDGDVLDEIYNKITNLVSKNRKV
ncbi:MAG: type I restriction endonuclease subunit R [Alphaproteobacteria bacterium]